MKSRERVRKAINHQETDRIPEKFTTKRDDEGNIYLYPQGDNSVPQKFPLKI
jgi:hypothetical protein